MEPDARGRYLDGWCEILNYGIKRHSMNQKRWTPPDEQILKELKGKSTKTTKSKLNPYINEIDLERLLNDLQDNDPQMYLAVGLIGIFGLRSSEIAVLEVEDGKLYVGHIKNNEKTSEQNREARRVFPMDIVGRQGEGNKLINIYIEN